MCKKKKIQIGKIILIQKKSILQNSETEIMTKFKNLNCDKN